MQSFNLQTLKFWLPAMAGMTCLGLGAGLIALFGFFAEPVAAEFEVGVATVNIAPVALLLMPGIIAPFVGRLVDTWPIRRMLLGGSAFALLSLFSISLADSLWQAGLGFLCFSIGITFYGPVVVNGLMVKTYREQEGRALAIAAMGISVASVILPPVVGLALQWLDWRQALGALALTLLAVLWFWVLLAVPAGAGATVEAEARGVDRSLFRQREFWLIGITVALVFNAMVVLTICYPPLFSSRGFTAVQAGLFLAVAGSGGALGKFTVALVADRWRHRARLLAAGLMLFKLLGLVLLLNVSSTYLVALSVFIMGFSGGAFLPIHPYLNSRYFRAEIIGKVNGAQGPLFLPLGLVGPPLSGYVYDQTGSYDLVLVAIGAAMVLAMGTVLALPRPRH